MKINAFRGEGFRNLSPVDFCPCEEINIIMGENAQGKTNLMEALWLFTGAKSFRGAKDAEMAAFSGQKTKLELFFNAQNRDQTAKIAIQKNRQASLNGIALTSPAKLAGNFCAVVFSPAHLSLIKDGPQLRRRFIDGAICQIKPKYANYITDYKRALIQRNALLKDVRFHSELYDLMDVWEEKLASFGAAILLQRRKYLQMLSPLSKKIYAGLSGAREEFGITYLSQPELTACADMNEMSSALRVLLKNARIKDISTGFTTVGPHRDDIITEINGASARAFGSQGQQRSCVLALKLGEAALLEKFAGEAPVILLDDVMSELDAGRQDYILNHVRGWQVFVTCCEPVGALKDGGKRFVMSAGVLSEEKE